MQPQIERLEELQSALSRFILQLKQAQFDKSAFELAVTTSVQSLVTRLNQQIQFYRAQLASFHQKLCADQLFRKLTLELGFYQEECGRLSRDNEQLRREAARLKRTLASSTQSLAIESLLNLNQKKKLMRLEKGRHQAVQKATRPIRSRVISQYKRNIKQ